MIKNAPVNEVETSIAAANASGVKVTGNPDKKIKPRFTLGDRFYQYLTHKRTKGKWGVKR